MVDSEFMSFCYCIQKDELGAPSVLHGMNGGDLDLDDEMRVTLVSK